jgi:hypothetical protein
MANYKVSTNKGTETTLTKIKYESKAFFIT